MVPHSLEQELLAVGVFTDEGLAVDVRHEELPRDEREADMLQQLVHVLLPLKGVVLHPGHTSLEIHQTKTSPIFNPCIIQPLSYCTITVH